MELKVKDVARLFNVPEDTVYAWIERRELPSCRVRGQHRFNREALLEWATANGINTTPQFFPGNEQPHENAGIASALEAGGIFYGVKGDDKQAVLKNVVGALRLPEKLDRDFLLQMLLAREALASTGIGNGVALPHTRNPIVLAVERPMVTLLFLEKPIDFGAVDNVPVHTLFTLVSPTIRTHLNILSRIAFLLHDPGFMALLEKRPESRVIIDAVRRIENTLGAKK